MKLSVASVALLLQAHLACSHGFQLFEKDSGRQYPPLVNKLKTNTIAGASRNLLDSPVEAFPPGIWISRGYGFTFDTRFEDASDFQYYEETDISCISNPYIPYYVESVELINNTVATADVDSLQLYVFDLHEDFQGACKNGLTPVKGDDNYVHDAQFVFDVLDQTFLEHYAFFDLRSIDWANLTAQARMNLSPDSTDEQLAAAMVEVLGPLHDGHVTLETDDDDFESKPMEVITQLFEEFEEQDEVGLFERYVNNELIAWYIAVLGYMDNNELKGDFGELAWGTLMEGRVGYINLISMSPEDDDYFYASLEEAFVDLHETESMILDVRINGGGQDRISLDIVSHFVKESYFAFSKKAVNGNGFTEPTDVWVDPVDDESVQYIDRPICLLTSGSTVSAAEIFVIAMSGLDTVTLMGRNTSGELSDMLSKTLPNLWSLTLSNEIYTTPAGVLYEMVGVPPEVETTQDLLPLEERRASVDSWIEEAVAYLESTTNSTTGEGVTSPPSVAPTQGSTGAPTDDSGVFKFDLSLGINVIVICVLALAL
eukprot:Nitzschia sp. Nitz4//scaffold10_size219509//173349//174974//NITZ4_001453-RA/size219509-processed-gene-0.145-mRNA-1//-1//CDS//3329532995//2065//frame0